MRLEDRPRHTREVVCVEITDALAQKFNTTLIKFDTSLDVDHTGLDAPTKQVLCDNIVKFEEIARRVGRVHTKVSMGAGSGVIFAVAPTLLMACRHTCVLGGASTRSISTGVQSFHCTDINKPVAIQEVPIDKVYLDNLAANDRTPMSSLSTQQDDFKDFDIALFTLPSHPWHKLFSHDWSPLFPDINIPNEGAGVAAIHYPGDPNGPEVFSIPGPGVNRNIPVGTYLRIFRVLGQKSISVGKRLIATDNPSNNIMAYDLAMLAGSSGAPIVRLDAPPNTFCGIHIGGEYYQDHRYPRGWNHGYTVANPHFVLLYLRYVVPFWGMEIPEEVRLYVRTHHNIINAHRNWLSSTVADELLLL